MRLSIVAAGLAGLVVAVPAAAAGKKQAGRPTVIERSLFSDSETRLGQFGWLSNDCTEPLPDVHVVKKPAKGELRFEKSATTVTASHSAVQKKCFGKPVEVMAVYYRAEQGSIGADKIVLDVDSKLGKVFRFAIQVDIRAGTAEGAKPGTAQQRLVRIVLQGNETRLGAPNYLNADCSSGPIPDLRIVAAPKNGTYRTEETEISAERPAGNVRAACNGKPVQALAFYYKPNADFIGEDEIVVDIDYRNGTVRRYDYAISVH